MTHRNLSDYLKDPHIVAWLILVLMSLGIMIFFDFFKQYFLKIAFIGILFIIFFVFDDFIFKTVGKSVKDIFSGNLFVKRWKAFPIFLAEIYIIYLISELLQNWLTQYLAPEVLKWWYVLIWMAIMFAFYWYKASRN